MAEFIFDSCKAYAEGWEEQSSRAFNAEEINAIRSNCVTQKDYGKSVCFFMKSGKQYYIPLGKFSQNVELGSSVDLSKARIVTIYREGDGKKTRIEVM